MPSFALDALFLDYPAPTVAFQILPSIGLCRLGSLSPCLTHIFTLFCQGLSCSHERTHRTDTNCCFLGLHVGSDLSTTGNPVNCYFRNSSLCGSTSCMHPDWLSNNVIMLLLVVFVYLRASRCHIYQLNHICAPSPCQILASIHAFDLWRHFLAARGHDTMVTLSV
jgi:hypothetical protein